MQFYQLFRTLKSYQSDLFRLRKIYSVNNHEWKRNEILDACKGWSKLVIVLRTNQNYILGAYCPIDFSNKKVTV